MSENNSRFIPMSREKAIDGIMLAFVESSRAPGMRFVPSSVIHMGAESALAALGVTEDELDAWGKRTIEEMLGGK